MVLKIADYVPTKTRLLAFVFVYAVAVAPLFVLFFFFPPLPDGKWPASFLSCFDLSILATGIASIGASGSIEESVSRRRNRFQ